MIEVSEFQGMFLCAMARVKAAKQELTDIDSRFGDADHGITMEKIADAAMEAIEAWQESSFSGLLEEISAHVMKINGGSAVPLWSTLLSGMAEGAPEGGEMDTEALKRMFQRGRQELFTITPAKTGDKTMMDALLPAIEAIEQAEGDATEILRAGAEAARLGAERSAGFVSKFGRAKSYGEKTIGTPDAGAVSMQYFFIGLYEGILNT